MNYLDPQNKNEREQATSKDPSQWVEPCTLTHAHGICKTLADILVTLNDERHFTDPEEVFAALEDYSAT